MRISLYSVHDKLLGVYLAPFGARGDIEAFRQIAAVMTDPQTKHLAMVTNPDDFSLCLIGSFDDETGHLSTEDRGRFGPLPLTSLRGIESMAKGGAPGDATYDLFKESAPSKSVA